MKPRWKPHTKKVCWNLSKEAYYYIKKQAKDQNVTMALMINSLILRSAASGRGIRPLDKPKNKEEFFRESLKKLKPGERAEARRYGYATCNRNNYVRKKRSGETF